MDTDTLVTVGQRLLDRLDETELRPRFAMWYKDDENDRWKFWVVPPKGFTDKPAFYRRIASIMAKEPNIFEDFDASATEMVSDHNRGVIALGKVLRMSGPGHARLSGNAFDGFYLPDGILFRSDL